MTWDTGAGLDGSAALVTGAAGGIGRAIACSLEAAGVRLALLDTDRGALHEVQAMLTRPAEHTVLDVDLRDVASIQTSVETAAGRLGRLDVLAHSAAVLLRARDLDAITVDDWEAQEQVNLRATFFLCRAVAQVMRSQGNGGRIINFSSQGWWTGGLGGSTVYAATKGGVVSLSRGLARELAPDGILVNCIAPGAVDTPMMRSGMTDEALAAFVRQIPLGRLARPEEIAGAVVFLASRHASYITGATLNISGGQLMY